MTKTRKNRKGDVAPFRKKREPAIFEQVRLNVASHKSVYDDLTEPLFPDLFPDHYEIKIEGTE